MDFEFMGAWNSCAWTFEIDLNLQPLILEIVENNQEEEDTAIVFQQDGAPVHFYR